MPAMMQRPGLVGGVPSLENHRFRVSINNGSQPSENIQNDHFSQWNSPLGGCFLEALGSPDMMPQIRVIFTAATKAASHRRVMVPPSPWPSGLPEAEAAADHHWGPSNDANQHLGHGPDLSAVADVTWRWSWDGSVHPMIPHASHVSNTPCITRITLVPKSKHKKIALALCPLQGEKISVICGFPLTSSPCWGRCQGKASSQHVPGWGRGAAFGGQITGRKMT